MAARPTGSDIITFGLLDIPVQLMPGERHVGLHFRMLDARNHVHSRRGRVNEQTGEQASCKEVMKAFEYDRGNQRRVDVTAAAF